MYSPSSSLTLHSAPGAPRRNRARGNSISNFSTTALFNQEITNFFANATIGSLVNGEFKLIEGYNDKSLPDNDTLQPTQVPLNYALFFVQPQVQMKFNPLYRIINSGVLTSLFALHAYYSQMTYPQDRTRLSASQEMRQMLRQSMINIINKDAQRLIQLYIDNYSVIDQVINAVQVLISNIDNPNNINPNDGIINLPVSREEMFNPNYFLYAHFSKLISDNKVRDLTEEELNSIRPLIRQVYANVIPPLRNIPFDNIFIELQQETEQTFPPYEIPVIDYQQNIVSLARAYKNLIQSNDILRQRGRPVRHVNPTISIPLPLPSMFNQPQSNLQLPQVSILNQSPQSLPILSQISQPLPPMIQPPLMLNQGFQTPADIQLRNPFDEG